jgi:hypothetical protein
MKEMIMNKFVTLTVLAATLALAGCDEPRPSSDAIQNQKQEELSKQGVESVGLPAIKNFQEKRILKDILELRDNPKFATYTYTEDMNGKLHLRCQSIGYGIPYATQYTSPQKLVRGDAGQYYSDFAMPQADPNGLFSPASADGTWVLCKVPGKDDVQPVYMEPRIVVSPFPLQNN